MFQTGDAAAFEALFDKYKGPIYIFLVRQCGNKEVASDLTQDVFTKLIKKADTFKHQSKFSTWIYTVARNTAMDHARKSKHRKHASLDASTADDGPALIEKVSDDGPTPERRSNANELQKALAAAIEKLPADQREVFILREYHGMPFAEISEVVEAKVGTVKSRMRYALESLRQELHQYEDYAKELS
ncbi:MAG: RNA polymerase sigma factor [Deltaproteobacteria bacterium]|nr:RNA polymerase sigma factor [Deltaproteobacteria bacterium]MBN2673592.1 RNA polymerase sigma factor [Deltaproteobacteria bacterium]